MNKTTNDNIENRQDALHKISWDMAELAREIGWFVGAAEPAVFDGMVGDVIAKTERALTATKAIVMATGTGPDRCRHMNSVSKTTNDNIEGRQDAVYKVGDDLDEFATVAEDAEGCEEPVEFDEMVGDMIAGLEKALTDAKAVRCA